MEEGKKYISEDRMSEYDALIKQYIEEHGGGAESIAIEDKPALNKLLVTLNPNDPQTMAQYLVARDPYTAPATPTFSPASGGSGNGSLAVTISTATAGASVRYKINGGAWQTGTSVTLQQDTAQESKAYTIIAKKAVASSNSFLSVEYSVFDNVSMLFLISLQAVSYSSWCSFQKSGLIPKTASSRSPS